MQLPEGKPVFLATRGNSYQEGNGCNMNRITELQRQRAELIALKRMLDKDASLQTWEGWAYVQTLTKLVVINLELEALQKEKAAR